MLILNIERLDFKTFGKFWDITFNKQESLKGRVQGFFETISFLRGLSDSYFQHLIKSLNSDVEHNYKNITTGKFRRISNNDFFEEVVNAGR